MLQIWARPVLDCDIEVCEFAGSILILPSQLYGVDDFLVIPFTVLFEKGFLVQS